jgi:acetyltransferase-like isoleucine patch superfamily enzyme
MGRLLAMEVGADLERDSHVEPGCTVGLVYKEGCAPARIGRAARIRSGTIIYGDVIVGEHFQTGHHVLIRERTTIGKHVTVGTNTVIEGQSEIGNFVKIESQCYVATHASIGDRVFMAPGVILVNDRYPLKKREDYRPEGPIIEDGVTLGAGVVVCPGVRIGKGSFIAAGAVVTKDVPPESLVKGVPGVVSTLPDELRELNMALSWRAHIDETPSELAKIT